MDSQIILNYDGPEAKGVVRIETGYYGPWIYVNDRCVAMIDLFHLTDNGEDEHGKYPQVVIFADHENDDPVAHAMILEEKVMVRFERHHDWFWENGRNLIVEVKNDEVEHSNQDGELAI